MIYMINSDIHESYERLTYFCGEKSADSCATVSRL